MTVATLTRMALWWLAILLFAMLNGMLREFLLIPSLGTFAAFVMSGLLLTGIILLVAVLAVPGLGLRKARDYWVAGCVWLAMTLIFEFGFGLFVQHKPLAELLEAYTFRGGNLWPLVLASTFVSPWLAARLRGLI